MNIEKKVFVDGDLLRHEREKHYSSAPKFAKAFLPFKSDSPEHSYSEIIKQRKYEKILLLLADRLKIDFDNLEDYYDFNKKKLYAGENYIARAEALPRKIRKGYRADPTNDTFPEAIVENWEAMLGLIRGRLKVTKHKPKLWNFYNGDSDALKHCIEKPLKNSNKDLIPVKLKSHPDLKKRISKLPDYHIKTKFFDSIKKRIVRQLDTNQVVPLRLCISGIEGSGKTTISKEIFNDVDISNTFNGFNVIVHVKEEYTDLTIQQIILHQLNSSHLFSQVSESNRIAISTILHNNSHLIIIDGINSRPQLESLDFESLSCSVIITTCDKRYGYLINAIIEEINELTPQESRKLFLKCAENSSIYSSVDTEAIISKCCNLPIALVLVGAMLKHFPKNKSDITSRMEKGSFSEIYNPADPTEHSCLSYVISKATQVLGEQYLSSLIELALLEDCSIIPEDFLRKYFRLSYISEIALEEFIYTLKSRQIVKEIKLSIDQIESTNLQYKNINKKFNFTKNHLPMLYFKDTYPDIENIVSEFKKVKPLHPDPLFKDTPSWMNYTYYTIHPLIKKHLVNKCSSKHQVYQKIFDTMINFDKHFTDSYLCFSVKLFLKLFESKWQPEPICKTRLSLLIKD